MARGPWRRHSPNTSFHRCPLPEKNIQHKRQNNKYLSFYFQDGYFALQIHHKLGGDDLSFSPGDFAYIFGNLLFTVYTLMHLFLEVESPVSQTSFCRSSVMHFKVAAT
ncbi:unnamed protein product [Ixodes pacificus]